jgi:hypothetical protein
MYFTLAEFWPKPAGNPVLSLQHYSVEKGKISMFLFELWRRNLETLDGVRSWKLLEGPAKVTSCAEFLIKLLL